MNDLAQRFLREHPESFLLDAGDPGALEAYLRERGLLGVHQRVSEVGRAGEGNMNCTLRVRTPAGSLIVKQARPWVEKYPQFAAPWDRALSEAEFYRAVAAHPAVAARMPRLIDADPVARVLVLEDLGAGCDATAVYAGERLGADELQGLAEFLAELHAIRPEPGGPGRLTNRAMRELNHAHVFVVPFVEGNGLDLDRITPGLEAVAQSLRKEAVLVREIQRLGREVYLTDGESLLHGDFFPGSLLRTPFGPRVIDPEFGFFGRPEFDLGVFLAHLLLSAHPVELLQGWRRAYRPDGNVDDRLMVQVAGVEILRRLLGYAQLPLPLGLEKKRSLLQLAARWVREPPGGIPREA